MTSGVQLLNALYQREGAPSPTGGHALRRRYPVQPLVTGCALFRVTLLDTIVTLLALLPALYALILVVRSACFFKCLEGAQRSDAWGAPCRLEM